MSCCNYAVQLHVVFGIKTAFQTFQKDVLLTLDKSLVIYEFKCQCGADYVGRTLQRLGVRLAQHVPARIQKSWTSNKNILTSTSGHSPIHESAIGQHLLDNKLCGESDSCFSIVHRSHSKHLLSILESLGVTIRKPSLCRQNELFLKLEVFKEL